MTKKPTQKELDTCFDVLEYLLEKTRKDEPYATNFIAALEAVLEGTSPIVDEI